MKALRFLIDKIPPLARYLRNIRDDRAINSMTLQSVPGFELKIWGGSWLAAGHYNDQSRFHETQEIELFSKILDKVDILIDVGANNGLFSLVAASKGVNVFAVEPMPSNITILSRNIIQNNMEDKVEIFQVAASNCVGLADIYGRGQMASLVANWNNNPIFDKKLVPMNTIDNLFYNRIVNKEFAIKIDVEGAELSVLLGASNIISRHPYVLIENCLNFEYQDSGITSFERIFNMFWAESYTAIVADDTRQIVDKSVIDSWISNGRVGATTVNFLMIPPGGSAH